MRLAIFLILLFQGYFIKSQNNFINVTCSDFTYNDKSFPEGKKLRRTFEQVLSDSGLPFRLVERENLAFYLRIIQEEINLKNDYNGAEASNVVENIAENDYIILGNVQNAYGSNEYSINIDFVKISGKSVLLRLPMSITLDREEINDYGSIKANLAEELKVFAKSFFPQASRSINLEMSKTIIERDQLNDSIINSMQNELNEKEVRINALEQKLRLISNFIVKVTFSQDSILAGDRLKEGILGTRYILFMSEKNDPISKDNIVDIFRNELQFYNGDQYKYRFSSDGKFLRELHFQPIFGQALIGEEIQYLSRFKSVVLQGDYSILAKDQNNFHIELQILVNGYPIVDGIFRDFQTFPNSTFCQIQIQDLMEKGILQYFSKNK